MDTAKISTILQKEVRTTQKKVLYLKKKYCFSIRSTVSQKEIVFSKRRIVTKKGILSLKKLNWEVLYLKRKCSDSKRYNVSQREVRVP